MLRFFYHINTSDIWRIEISPQGVNTNGLPLPRLQKYQFNRIWKVTFLLKPLKQWLEPHRAAVVPSYPMSLDLINPNVHIIVCFCRIFAFLMTLTNEMHTIHISTICTFICKLTATKTYSRHAKLSIIPWDTKNFRKRLNQDLFFFWKSPSINFCLKSHRLFLTFTFPNS